MTPLDARSLAAAIGAEYVGPDLTVEDICTDTRRLTPGCLFVALEGENFDGHDYIQKALECGAALAVSHRPSDNSKVLRVGDTRTALLSIAGCYRRLLGLKVVGITGSVGKTTTKEMTACVLQSAYHTLKTPANLNNEVGLSQTILSLEEAHAAAVLELGVDGPGQMLPLSACAAPDVGIVTGVGVSHLAKFGSRQEILREKLDIRAGMPDGAPLLLCGDNDLLAGFSDSRLRVVMYGIDNPENDVRAEELREENGVTSFVIRWQGARYPAVLPAAGRHNVCNALAAFGAGALLGVEPRSAADSLNRYQPQGMRQRIVSRGGLTVVEDCYNASPDSMRAALETLRDMSCQGRRIAVLSDMLELGPSERGDHFSAGEHAAKCGLDALLCTGELAAGYAEGAASSGMARACHFDSPDALLDELSALALPGDVIWFKASRGMRLERVIEGLYARLENSG